MKSDTNHTNPSNQYEEEEQNVLQCFNKILKIIKQREQNYFRLYEFIKKNIDNNQIETQQTTILSIYLSKLQTAEYILIKEQQVLINQQRNSTIKNKKFISRLSARIYQFFQTSIVKINPTFFYSPTIDHQYKAFKDSINQIITLQKIRLIQLIEFILKYSKTKFDRQYQKLNRFLNKLQNGEQILLKQFYQQLISNVQLKIQNKFCSQKKSTQQKKGSRQSKQSKQKQKKQKQSSVERMFNFEQETKNNKINSINKIYKIYSVIDISKNQFFEDYLYQENTKEIQKNKLITILKTKNRDISQQIMIFYNRVQMYSDRIQYLRNNPPKQTKCHTQQIQDYPYMDSKFKNNISTKTNNFFVVKANPEIYNCNSFIKLPNQDVILNQNKNTQTLIGSISQRVSTNHHKPQGEKQILNIQKKYMEELKLTNFNKNNQLPNLSRPMSRLKQSKDGGKLLNYSSSKIKIQKNKIFMVKSPVLFENQNLSNNFSGQLTELARRNSLLDLEQIIRNQYKPNIKKITRHLLKKNSTRNQRKKTVIFINDKKQEIIFPETDRPIQSKKQYNIRYKNPTKKNIFISENIFIEKLDDQMNRYG